MLESLGAAFDVVVCAVAVPSAPACGFSAHSACSFTFICLARELALNMHREKYSRTTRNDHQRREDVEQRTWSVTAPPTTPVPNSCMEGS